MTNDGETWRRWIDTALDPPHEIVEWQYSATGSGSNLPCGARSVVVLIAGSKWDFR